MNKITYKNLAAFHPGYYIKELIEEMEITQSEFALRLDTTGKTLSKLINGEIPLSKNLAENLSLMTGTSVSVWLNLQAKYDEQYCIIECERKIDTEKDRLTMLHYDYFVKLGFVENYSEKNQQVKELCRVLNVASLSVLEKQDLLTACKTSISEVDIKNVVNANAWIQLGKIMARDINCKPYSQDNLLKAIPIFRSLTRKVLSTAFEQIQKIFFDCGVALVALPYMKDSGLNGAVQWINNNKVMLLINDRGKDAAKFWFTLFHEIDHILHKKTTFTYLTSEDKNSKILFLGRANEDEEKMADNFAKNQLIPSVDYNKFVAKQNFSLSAIQKFADTVGIATYIVIGRLKHDHFLNWNDLTNHQPRYQFICPNFNVN